MFLSFFLRVSIFFIFSRSLSNCLFRTFYLSLLSLSFALSLSLSLNCLLLVLSLSLCLYLQFSLSSQSHSLRHFKIFPSQTPLHCLSLSISLSRSLSNWYITFVYFSLLSEYLYMWFYLSSTYLSLSFNFISLAFTTTLLCAPIT